METEAKAKVVASVWGAKFVQFLAVLAVLLRSIWKKRLNSTNMICDCYINCGAEFACKISFWSSKVFRNREYYDMLIFGNGQLWTTQCRKLTVLYNTVHGLGWNLFYFDGRHKIAWINKLTLSVVHWVPMHTCRTSDTFSVSLDEYGGLLFLVCLLLFLFFLPGVEISDPWRRWYWNSWE